MEASSGTLRKRANVAANSGGECCVWGWAGVYLGAENKLMRRFGRRCHPRAGGERCVPIEG